MANTCEDVRQTPRAQSPRPFSFLSNIEVANEQLAVHSQTMNGPAALTDLGIQELATALHHDALLRPQIAALMGVRVEDALHKYFNTPSRFREAMGNARAALSGSWVLHFIMKYSSPREPAWTEGDLDIYCPEEGVAIIMSYLLDEGYYPSQTQEHRPSMMASKGKISRLFKFDHAERGQKVDVVCIHADTPFEVVLKFWTTLVMNVVTVHDLTLLYPELTLAKQGRQPLERIGTNGVGGLVNKYIRRGFQVWPFSRQRENVYEPAEVRSTRDNRCLVLPIAAPTGYERGPLGSTVTVWRLKGFEGTDRDKSFVHSMEVPYKDLM
ncbi:hypothetical protein K488DRAFT_90097 [Vararia minispora EC-137]|uniref:Uncharacterized protein n=1 Tax=Vararia minispora EC-137 TaxID=1314806 RepID=A0ACB8Q8W6_9AGAM|nr:hypothetical protein K488DRAFT_90097 [Vararia minispora EC-137]